MKLNSTWHWSIICGLLLIARSQAAAQAQGQPLPQPESITVDRSLSPADAAQMIKTARLFYAFGIQETRSMRLPQWTTIFVTTRCRQDGLKVPKACFMLRRLFEMPCLTFIARSKTCWLAAIKSPRGFSSPALTKVSSWAILRPASR